jgi:hypothetical protein
MCVCGVQYTRTSEREDMGGEDQVGSGGVIVIIRKRKLRGNKGSGSGKKSEETDRKDRLGLNVETDSKEREE